MKEIKMVSYSFSSSVIEYNSNEKLFEAWSWARFYKKSTLCLIMIWRKLDRVETNCIQARKKTLQLSSFYSNIFYEKQLLKIKPFNVVQKYKHII